MRAIWLNINDFSREPNQSNWTISINRNYSQFIIVHYQQNTCRSIDKYRWIECLYRRYWSEHSYFLFNLFFAFHIQYQLHFNLDYVSHYISIEIYRLLRKFRPLIQNVSLYWHLGVWCQLLVFLNGFRVTFSTFFAFFPHKISLRHFFARFWCDFYRNYLMTWLTP